MNKKTLLIIVVVSVLLLLLCGGIALSSWLWLRKSEESEDSTAEQAEDTGEEADGESEGDEADISSSDEPVRLIFIHHSCGENWLTDENGGLGITLRDNNYFVSDTNYGWGPDSIGDLTDIGHWWTWFPGPDSETYLEALYEESEQNSEYSRLAKNPGGENEIIMFKSCFPNSYLQGNSSDPIPSISSNPLRGESSDSEYHTVANAKGIYIDLLEYFETRQDKLFIVITAPPLGANNTEPAIAQNARNFNNWLANDWLDGYEYDNVAIFDFFNVLTDDGASNVLEYADDEWDDHPSREGNLKATEEFITFLNEVYEEWSE